MFAGFWRSPLRGLLRLLPLLTLAWPAAALELPPGTPVYPVVGLEQPPLAVLSETTELPAEPAEMLLIRQHPLARYYYFYRVELPAPDPGAPPVVGYVSPQITLARNAAGQLIPQQLDYQPRWRFGLFLTLSAILAALVVHLWRLRRSGQLSERALFYGALLAPVLIRQLLTLAVVIGGDNLITSPSDDPGYFETMQGFLKLDVSGPWNFTIGHGFWYLPFILLTGAREFSEILVPFSYFSGLVLAPLSLALGFLVLRRLSGSIGLAFCAVLLWALWPFFVHHVPDWNQLNFYSCFDRTSCQFNYRHYTTLIGCGFNALSDTASTLLVLTTLSAALFLPARKWYFFPLLGGIFGFACLCRINNLLFAPAIAYIVCTRFAPAEISWRFLLRAGALTALGFLALFGWQLWINAHQFGSIFTFPYVRHALDVAGPRPANGFTWQTFRHSQNLQFLAGSNLAVWTLGAAGLLFLRDARLRIALALWALPVIWFFYGYSHTFCDPVRFILSSYLPLFAAFAGAVQTGFKTLSRRDLVLTGALLTLGLLAGGPVYAWGLPLASWQRELPTALLGTPALLIPAAALFVWFRHGGRRDAALLGTIGILYLLGNGALFAALFAGILLWSVGWWLKELFLRGRRPTATPEAGNDTYGTSSSTANEN